MNRGKVLRISGIAFATAGFAALLGGCASSTGLLDPLESTGRITTTAANQLFPDRYDLIDLVTTLDPENKRFKYKPGHEPAGSPAIAGPATTADQKEAAQDAASWEFSAALRAFYDYGGLELRRNRLQDELLMRSETRCNIYKNYLKRVESTQGIYTGILSTVLGGVGAITKDIGRAQLHSALSAISSGVGAELKQGFFSDVAVAVLIPGIDEKRAQVHNKILKLRSTTPSIQNYTIEAALRDVAEYHGACSIVVGLDAAKDAIREVRNPGIVAMNDTLRKLRVTVKLLDKNADLGQIDAEIAALGGGTGGGIVTTGRLDSGTPIDLWTQRFSALNSLISSTEVQIVDRAAQSEVKDGAKAELKKILAKQYTPPGGKAGCGIDGMRTRVRDQMSSELATYGKHQNAVASAQAALRFEPDDAARAKARAKLEETLAAVLTDSVRLQRYYDLLAILGRDISKKLEKYGVDAAALNADSSTMAKDIVAMAQTKLSDGTADTSIDCH